MKCRTKQSRLTSIAQKRIFSIPKITGELGYSSKRSCSRADTRYSNAATGREASLEEQIQDRRRETSEEVFDEIIDPTFLYTESSSFTYAKHAFVGTTVEDNGNHDPFLRNTQYSPWADASSTESEHSETEKPVQTPENIPGDSLAEPQECEILESQIFSMGSYDEYVIKELACEESSYGFAISSGWSSTFFPSEIEEEPQVSMNMAAKGAKCSHLTC